MVDKTVDTEDNNSTVISPGNHLPYEGVQERRSVEGLSSEVHIPPGKDFCFIPQGSKGVI